MAMNTDIVTKCMGSILTHSWAGFSDVAHLAEFARVTDLDMRTMPAQEIQSTVPEFWWVRAERSEVWTDGMAEQTLRARFSYLNSEGFIESWSIEHAAVFDVW